MSGRALRFVWEPLRLSKLFRSILTRLSYRHRPYPGPVSAPHARPHARLAGSPPAASPGPGPSPHSITL